METKWKARETREEKKASHWRGASFVTGGWPKTPIRLSLFFTFITLKEESDFCQIILVGLRNPFNIIIHIDYFILYNAPFILTQKEQICNKTLDIMLVSFINQMKINRIKQWPYLL